MTGVGEPMNRRTFLTALGLGGATVVVSCSSDDRDASNDRTSKRVDVGSSPADVPVPDAPLTADPFTLGVASGDPDPTSVILWTRLVTELTDPVDVKWEVAADDAFDRVLAAGVVSATPELAHSIHLEATDLDADTWYWYRFSSASYVSPVGRARTMPADDATPERIRLGFASCQDFTEGYYPAHRAMAADRLDLVFFLGDFIYESGSSPDSVRQVPGGTCRSHEDYVARYATYLGDADLQASRAACPWIVTWDDHEVENNYADLANNSNLPADVFTERRAGAYLAYYEHMPLRLDPPTGADWRIYRSLRFGKLAEFFVLDGRQYRSDQACNSKLDAIVKASSCPELDAADRTMLGSDQESWLSEGLTASDAAWKVLAQQTVMSSLVLGDIVLNVDQWDGYPAARQRLLQFIGDRDIADVVVLTGDIHSAGAGDLGTVAADGTRTPVAVEFVGTSITSASLVDIVPGGAALVTPDKFPGIAYLNVVDHGYGRCTVTADEWRTEFVVVDSVTDAGAPSRIDATCVTPRGTPSVTKV